MKTILKLGLAASALLIGSMAQACTLTAWTASSGAVAAGGPNDAALSVARFGGICSMQATGVGSVRDESPTAEMQIRLRFYFLAQGTPTGATNLLIAASDNPGATAVFTLSFDGTNVTMTSNDGGTNASAAVGSTNWHDVEVNWNQGGAIDLWVDSDAVVNAATPSASGTSGNAASTINSVTLGTPGGLGAGVTGVLFDAYESRRTTAIGALSPGDTNGDGGRNIFDAIGVVNEILNGTLGTGQPDCNRDGQVNIFDAICIVNIILGP